VFSYASMAWPQPDWLVPVAEEVAALDVVVLVDWAAARLAMAMMRAVVYCMLGGSLRMLRFVGLLCYVKLRRNDETDVYFQVMMGL
jgi:hypothetical protein